MIQDELAEKINYCTKIEQKLKIVEEKNAELTQELADYTKQSEKWKEFSAAIDQVEESGANYFALMAGIKSQMEQKLKLK